MHAKFELTKLSNERAHAIVVAVILNMQRLVQIVQDHRQIQNNQHAQMLKNTFLNANVDQTGKRRKKDGPNHEHETETHNTRQTATTTDKPTKTNHNERLKHTKNQQMTAKQQTKIRKTRERK